MTELSFVIKSNTYSIKVPTVGNMIDIERLKQSFSGGYYNEMIKTLTVPAQESLLIIDVQAHLSILCPQLMEDLKCEDIRKLSIEDYKTLKKAYVETFVPWWNKWMELFKDEDEKKK